MSVICCFHMEGLWTVACEKNALPCPSPYTRGRLWGPHSLWTQTERDPDQGAPALCLSDSGPSTHGLTSHICAS